MKVKLKIKAGVNPKVLKRGMFLGKHFVEREAKEFEFSKKEETLLKSKQFKFYMEKVGRVVNNTDTKKIQFDKPLFKDKTQEITEEVRSGGVQVE